ncbi:FMN-dependent NADH-azoreductase [Azospirillum sp. TSH100]|uniref:FMN-dependent NADH-azoreductase n=1 Tax=Azospirillum sp. TSH100 TaxID=652764 RepID=UPI000D61ACEE|nr:FMN-dependent NADH-azoreductase [Azospirillum sp. TSH100]PWC86602.1 FMN-dependent NADH-azoreductase [Azospirillum sp. TSH100]QCG86263.1 FMN-dependent NADH-azoreductase [Azospirillum sp. TSH100]
MKILHIDSSILGSGSLTRDLSAAVVAEILARHPAAEVSRRDVVETEIRHLDGAIAAGFRPTGFGDFDDATLAEHGVSEMLVSEFLASDILVIGAPMYNFSVSSQLKAWMDRIAQAGRTFKYTEKGPVGLSGGKRVIVVSARGGFYADGPLARMDFQESYLRAFFGFLGITDVHVVRAEGASKGDAVRSEGLERARAAIAGVIAALQPAAA